ncbi:MAG TPA: substrate-binding domain-containing protein [Desulfobaccales bacterium]|nr:substrate-binding domain-containing protein [Desulfobaccales bacterium]
MLKKFPAMMAGLVFLASLTAAAAAAPFNGVYGTGPEKFTLATGSPGELGLLQALAKGFDESMHGKITLQWVKAGSGKSLQLLKAKKVDMIMVHAPAAEMKAVKEGWATDRTLLGSNEFYIVGPVADPAKIAAAKSAVDAYRRINVAKAKFFSRGDNSGTNKKELMIWRKAGIKPAGPWYIVTRDFMTATLKRANQGKGYFMVDSSTWVAEKKAMPHLKVLYRGDKMLVNTYHALCQPAGATPKAALAAKFIAFVASPAGQQIIKDYGKDRYGEALYNDAAYARRFAE